MNVPNGFGFVKIIFDGQTALLFKIYDYRNSKREEIEVKDEDIDLDGNYDKEVKGYRLRFCLPLIDAGLPSAQDNVNRFLYHHRYNRNPDKSFQIYPAWNADLEDFRNRDAGLFRVIMDTCETDNILSGPRKGHLLSLVLKTRDIIPPEQYDCLLYRESNSGVWGVYGRNETVMGQMLNVMAGAVPGLD